jgi:iron complex outermembrane recepter protein
MCGDELGLRRFSNIAKNTSHKGGQKLDLARSYVRRSPHTTIRRGIKIMRIATVLAVALLGTTCFAESEHATAAIKHYQLNIPRQSLDTALKDLAQQTGLQIGRFSGRVDGGAMVGPVKGDQTPAEALKALLRDTGLDYKIVSDTTIAVYNPKDTSATAPAESNKSQASKEGTQSQSFWDRFRVAQANPGATADTSSVGGQQTSKPPQSSEPQMLQEVVVTAQKRAERLQDVPISISALQGSALDSSPYEGISEALTTVPGVSLLGENGSSVNGAGTLLTIRGVAAGGTLYQTASPIGYYIDSVPFGLVRSAGVPDADVYDLQRIEVLRGPQGTLYGANSEGGLVRILTNDADLNGGFSFKARTSLSYTDGGGDQNYRGDAAINIPLVDDEVAARLVIGDQHYAGWINSPTQSHVNDADLFNLRLKINAQPTDDLSIGLSAWHSQDTYGGLSAGRENNFTDLTIPQPGSVTYTAYGLKVGYDFKSFTLSSQTSYLTYSSEQHLDLTAQVSSLAEGPVAPLYLAPSTKIFSQELTLSSALEGPWQWTAGAFFRDGQDEFIELGEVLSEPVSFPDKSKSAAVYGELSQRFLDNQLQWTLGGRYFHDTVSSSSRNPVNPDQAATNPDGPYYYESASYDKFTPRAVLAWYPQKDVTFYTSYAQGFRSGMPQDALIGVQAPDLAPLKPDTLDSYELGTKETLFDHHVSLDAAVYYIKWKDIQQELTIPVVVAGGRILPLDAYVNGQSASGPGAEFSIQILPADGFELVLAAGWNDLTFDSDVYSGGQIAFHEGERLQASPEWTGGATVKYSFGISGTGYKVHLAGSGTYTSHINTGLLNGVLQNGDSTTIARASATLETPSHWRITLYGDNLTNDQPITALSYGAADWSARLRPRTAGLQLDYAFGQ